MDDEEEEVTDLKLQLFHNTIREHIVSQRVSVWRHITPPLYIYESAASAAALRGQLLFLLLLPALCLLLLTVQRFALHACKFATKRAADKETTVTESRTTLVHIEFVLFMVLISTEYEAISIYDLSKQRRAIDAADFPCLFSLFVIVFLFGFRINRFPVRAAKSAEFQVFVF